MVSMTRRAVMVPSPSASASDLPTVHPWYLGDMADFGSGSRSLLEAAGTISASQEDRIAGAHFIGGEDEEEQQQEEEAEVFITPPLAQRGPQRQGEVEDGITMCSMPFTQTQPSPPSPASSASSDDSWQPPSKPRICTRKVRVGKFNPPPPAPPPAPLQVRAPSPSPGPAPPAPLPARAPSPGPELDPLVRIVLMIPTAPFPATDHVDIFELARSRGIFP